VDRLGETFSKTRELGEAVVTREDIAEVVGMWTGIPVTSLTEEETDRLLRMEAALHEHVVGQDAAIKAVASAVRRARAGVKDPRRPTGVFIFLGPTGVGKSHLAKHLAVFLFGDEDALVRIDMSEYTEKFSVSRLMGAPPGYVGYEESGQLTESVRRRPYSVVLLDEIEKAHPEVFNVLLQVMDDGRLTDSQGRNVDFKNTILIMTGNIGARLIAEDRRHGFASGAAPQTGEQSYERMKQKVMDELKRTFRPEFLNRVDDVLVFHALSPEEIRNIVDIELRRVQEQLRDRDIELELSDEVRDLLCSEGYDPRLGARPLRRAIQRLIEDPVAEVIIGRGTRPAGVVVGDVEDGEVKFRHVAMEITAP
jgi:ATP-dependent Clp protease ATP-binding subunit ClpC